ncbi:unnamed protein product [Phytomonas sp. Hart1]|nr:unnamed protein product [Phytomonas sp. Hart1]|eukprot:CCW69567.1 unnamed protein product [Phytomonas sp. isolate Hart1]
MERPEIDLPRRKEKPIDENIVYYEDCILGKGQFGTVYKGYCKSRNLEVAVKIFHDVTSFYASHTSNLHLNGNGDETAARAGRVSPPQEIKALAQLKARNCPNILCMHGSWIKKTKPENPNRVYVIVTEYCPGGDLHHWMQTKGKVSENVARRLIYQLCNALLVFKSECIIHRDIKPTNLLLTSKNLEEAMLKVADFGMAKGAAANPICDTNADRDDPKVSSVLFHSALGTPMYMSPERIRQKPYSYKADVYSAGMVLYELLASRPVRATRPAQLLTAVPDAIQHEVSRHQPDIPLWLDLLLGMAVEDPQRRLSVEAVLQHPWFAPENGPSLPPPIIPLLPYEAQTCRKVEREGGGIDPSPLDSISFQGPSAPPDEVQNSPLLSESCHYEGSIAGSLFSEPEDSRRDTTWWTTLSVSGQIPSSRDVSLTLPTTCGPYIVTFAVRNFVWCVLLYVVEAEAETAGVLIVLSFLMELIQNGYSAFIQDVEQMGGLCFPQHFVFLNDVWHELLNHLNALVAHHRRRLPPRLWQRLYPRAEAIILRKALSYIQEDSLSDVASGDDRMPHEGDSAAFLSVEEGWAEEKTLAVATHVDPEAQGSLSGYDKALALLRVLVQQAILMDDDATGRIFSAYPFTCGGHPNTDAYQQEEQRNKCIETLSTRSPLKYLIHVPVLATFEDEEDLLMVHTILQKLSSYMIRIGTRRCIVDRSINE